MRIGLTFDEYVELRLKPPAGADRVFHQAAEVERDEMFPTNTLGASTHLRSRGYDCRPPMLDLLVENSVVKLSQPDVWTQADVDAAADHFEEAGLFVPYAAMCQTLGCSYADFLRPLREAAEEATKKYRRHVRDDDQLFIMHRVPPRGFRLVVNEAEAVRVRAIFKLYLQHEALLPVVQELERRGWVNKRWTTRKGRERGGQPFERTSLYRLLTNVAYVGKVRYKDEVHDGEHPGIVDPAVFQRVQSLLQRNGQTRGAPVRNKFGALLKGIIRCVPCDCAMTPLHTTRNGSKRYRYYVCCSAQKRGWDTCPSKSIPAAQIEEFVVGQIKCIGQDRALLEAVLAEARRQGVTLPPLRTLPGSCQMCTTNAATQTTLASCCTR